MHPTLIEDLTAKSFIKARSSEAFSLTFPQLFSLARMGTAADAPGVLPSGRLRGAFFQRFWNPSSGAEAPARRESAEGVQPHASPATPGAGLVQDDSKKAPDTNSVAGESVHQHTNGIASGHHGEMAVWCPAGSQPGYSPAVPQGYMYITTHRDGHSLTTTQGDRKPNHQLSREVEPEHEPDYISDETFQKMMEDVKTQDGKYLAMTAYGAVPLPEQMVQKIPEKFVTKPLIQEREVFVAKKEHCTRVMERDYTQFEHRFIEVPQSLVVDKIKAIDDVKIIEIPHFKYTPVVEDKIVEIPQGIKYVEVPIEVPCRMPPRVVPVPKPHIVERIIETTKPVVQERIVEVPEVIKKKVPQIVTKEIPYMVPRYVEKVIEVPYQPGQDIPEPQGSQMMFIPQPPKLLMRHSQMEGTSVEAPQHSRSGPGVAGTPGFPALDSDDGDHFQNATTHCCDYTNGSVQAPFMTYNQTESGPILHPVHIFHHPGQSDVQQSSYQTQRLYFGTDPTGADQVRSVPHTTVQYMTSDVVREMQAGGQGEGTQHVFSQHAYSHIAEPREGTLGQNTFNSYTTTSQSSDIQAPTLVSAVSAE